jgi:hypothetical protein
MTIDTTLVKRRALYQGEIGFFPSTPMAEEDVAIAKMDSEVVCSFYSPRNLEALKFLWALVHKVAENTDRYLDKDEAMRDLKLRAGYTRVMYDNKTKELELRPKSLTRINNEQLRLLTEKIIDIVCDKLIPGMKRNELRKEVEKMCHDTR